MVPIGLDPAAGILGVLLAVNGIGAILAVDRYAKAAADKTDDGVARNGAAALGKLDGAVVDALDDDAVVGIGLLGRLLVLCNGLQRHGGSGLGQLGSLFLDLGDNTGDRHAAVTDIGIQFFLGVHLEALEDDILELGIGEIIHQQIDTQLALQLGLAFCDVLFLALTLEPLTDLGLGTGGLYDLQPAALGAGRGLGGNDIDDLAALQLVVEVDDTAVDMGADHVVADIAVSDDSRRVEFIRRALAGVESCVKDGIPVKGYMYWSLMDNFEWQKGFSMTFGLIAVDRATQMRTPKESLAFLGAYKQ
ncbi:MAG: family 1 glycosylhydrolase [Clostridia bacterium]|nr:family 1 glycosylhydrolase [Clostridia bacterium]